MTKENLQQKDQSMEEILQSIKRIIAEEGSEEAKPNGAAAAPTEDTHVKGSDILDFESIQAKDLAEKSAPVLELTDEVDEEEEPAAVEAPAPASLSTRAPKNEVDTSNRDVLADIDSLLSDETAKASAAALRSLSSAPPVRTPAPRPSPEFRSGNTVEDLVLEALRPMLKDWLDSNLPGLVQQLVEKEIRKLTS